MSQSTAKTPVWFWVIAIIAVLWNLVGVMSFVGMTTTTPEKITEMPAAEQALYNNTPVWSTIAFAIAVFGGLIGSLLLTLRKNLAMPFFIASMAGIIIQFGYWFLMTNAVEVYGAQTYTMPAMVTIIAAFLIWFSRLSNAKGWTK